MKNRNPKYPGRVQLTPVPGQANVYDMVRKDEPTEDGSIYSRGNVMPDAVCYAYGLDKVESEPKDVFLAIPGAMGKGLLVVTLQTASGAPIPNTLIDGLTGIDASRCRTDGNGVLQIYVDEGSYTLSSSEVNSYIDLSLGSTTVTVAAGEQKSVTLTTTTLTSATITTTSSIEFSSFVSAVDVFCVGGGGSGSTNTGSANYGGGGGGGYTTTALNVSVIPNTEYPAIIGAGGAQPTSYNSGNQGGSTSFLGIVANGGQGAGYRIGGNGGSGGAAVGGTAGTDGANASGGSYTNGTGQGTTTRPFGDASLSPAYAGGGSLQASGGVLGGGGLAQSGTPNTGGGGGGGNHDNLSSVGAGGSGVILLRWVANG